MSNDGSIMITGRENIERARWLAVRGALSLQVKGFTTQRGRRTPRMLANEITGTDHKTCKAAYAALNAKIVAELGPAFDRPLS